MDREKKNSPKFWEKIIFKAAQEVDYGFPIPEFNRFFVSVWAKHYHRISQLIKPKSPLLEIGTGFGVLAAGLHRLQMMPHTYIWSLEHPSRVFFSSASYRHFLSKNRIQLIGANLKEGLPFRSKTLRQVYFCDVIEHLLYMDASYLLSEIRRVLCPEGQLVFSTPNLNRLSNLVRFLLCHTVNPNGRIEKYGETFGHIREYAPKEIVHLLSEHRFEVTKMDFGVIPFFTDEAFGSEPDLARISNFVKRLTEMIFRVYPRAGDEIYAVAHPA